MVNKIVKGIRNGENNLQLSLSDIGAYMVSLNGKQYMLKIDNDGNLYTEQMNVPTGNIPQYKTPLDKSRVLLQINSLYCGGKDSDEHTLNYCSHNFVELANCTNNDLKLDGVSLQYTESGTDWEVLPLHGIIKAGSTFLIRGAKCSVEDSAMCKIHVNTYDMEWYNNVGNLISFSNTKAKFYLRNSIEKSTLQNPWGDGTTLDDEKYLDLVGLGINSEVDGKEKESYANFNSQYLMRKYYAMDPVTQANKVYPSKNNSSDWCFVDLTKRDGDVIPSIEDYTPKASFEGKNIFYNKTKISKERPSMITCSFGIQATDGGEQKRATRCFNWISREVDEQYIWIRKKGENSWGVPHESINGNPEYIGDSSTRIPNVEYYYNRLIKEYTDGSVFAAHKYIQRDLIAGIYEYVAGSKNEDNTPDLEHCTKICQFIVRSDEEVNNNGFTFVQTSDQQGFNWEEYQMWNYTSKLIMKEYGEHVQFMINTGDMTQNGNRMNEWLDYFNGECDAMCDLEEMATIGNNDLSPIILNKLGGGGDGDKVNLQNIMFFYTFELDKENPPIFKETVITNRSTTPVTTVVKDIYIPSLYSFNYGNTHFLCLNTEIKNIAEWNNTAETLYNLESIGNFYTKHEDKNDIPGWCERDINLHKKYWNIAYCHEMPFTIVTQEFSNSAKTIDNENEWQTITRGGSNANTNVQGGEKMNGYWFSEFCQTHNIRLVLGGHKHTQATSWPLLENISYFEGERKVNSTSPIIVLPKEGTDEFTKAINEFNNSTELKEYNGKKYPNKWFNGENLNKEYVRLCEFKTIDEIDNNITPVVYAMSQASGYKHTSNKELPSNLIPWLRYYYKQTETDETKGYLPAKANNGQKFPFFTLWTVKNEEIIGEVRKLKGAFNDKGKFDINIEGKYAKQGKSCLDMGVSDIVSINGLKEGIAEDSTEKIIIKH